MENTFDDMPEDLRKSLNIYYNDYHKKLSVSLENIKRSSIRNVNDSSNIAIPTEQKKLYDSFIEFHGAFYPIYETIFPEKSNVREQLLSDLVGKMQGITNLEIPLEDKRIREFLDRGVMIISDEEALKSSSKWVLESSVDFRRSTLLLLTYYSRWCFGLLTEYLSASFDLSRAFKDSFEAWSLSIKYRPRGVKDIYDIAIEQIEIFNSLNSGGGTHFVILFTNQQKEEFEKISFKFNSVFLDQAPEYADKVMLVPINLYLLANLHKELGIHMQSQFDDLKERDLSKLDLVRMFPGVWLNSHVYEDKRIGNETFEIRNGDQYYVKYDTEWKHVFNIDMVSINRFKKSIKFRKIGIGEDKRRAFNDLLIVSENEYRGTEFKGTTIKYTKQNHE